jgi:hypothetical protein
VLIAEEFLLLALDEESGRKTMGAESLEPALGAALIVELALSERIGVTPADAGWRERGRIRILNPAPTDDPELDGLLGELSRREGAKVKDLISPMSTKRITKGLPDRLVARLSAAGVLAVEEAKVLGLFPQRRFPTRNPEPEEFVRRNLQAALVGGETPTERTTVLIALLQATNRVTKVVHTEDKAGLKARAKQLSSGDWAAKAVKDAIAETYAVMASVGAAAGAAGSG